MTDIVFPENTKQTMSILIDKGITDQYRSIIDGAEELEKEFEKNRNSLIENKITLELSEE